MMVVNRVLPPLHHYDVIIIGGGLTGLRAALQLSRAGRSCAVLSKVHPLRSHSVAAQGGMNACSGKCTRYRRHRGQLGAARV